MRDDKAFITAEATNVNRTSTGLEGSASSTARTSYYPASSSVSVPSVKKSIITIPAYDAGEPARITSSTVTHRDRVARNTSVVQIGCFSGAATTPKKLSVDQLRSFQVSSLSRDSLKNCSVTFIGGACPPEMMTMRSQSSTTGELDNGALDSGTGSDLEINSSSSSLNNSITPPPPLPKKMNKTKEKLKSENEKFFHLRNYQQTQPLAHEQSLHSNNNNNHSLVSHPDQDDNMSVLSCGSNTSNCSSISLISCDSLNAANRRHRTQHQVSSPSTTMTTSGRNSPTLSSLDGADPSGLICSDPEKQNAIVLSVNASPPSQHHNHHPQKSLLPTSLLADIRQNAKRSSSNGASTATSAILHPSKKNVNVISIRTSGAEDSDYTSLNGGVGDQVVMEPEKYVSEKFISFSIHSMADEDVEDEDEETRDKGYFEGGQGSLKSVFGASRRKSVQFENDSGYQFHLNENSMSYLLGQSDKSICDTNEDSFAGYRDLTTAYSPMSGSSTIRSNKGTIRGVKNRVRNGIATFLQMQHANIKNYKEKDSGKVVVYSTTMGIVRDTYAKCSNVKQILRTLLVKFEERDVFMSTEFQQEIKDRMQSEEIKVPQLFVDGQYIGDAESVERLNESGELRKMLKPYQSMDASLTCRSCGGYRLLPCPSCKGSKKSVHRNHFTSEFIALKCMNCDEVGLVRCESC